MKRINRYKPKRLEIISILIALIIFPIVQPDNTDKIDPILRIILLFVGLIFGFIAFRMQWKSIEAARNNKN